MKDPVWHILKKDLGRLRYVIAFYLAALWTNAIGVAWVDHLMVGLTPARSLNTDKAAPVMYDLERLGGLTWDSEGLRWLQPLAAFLIIANIIGLMAMIMAVLLEDRALGDKAFWRTRPVSGTQMFTAKTIFIAILAWLPAILAQMSANALAASFNTPWASFIHLDDGLGVIVMFQTLWVSTMVAVACLWRNVLVGYGTLFFIFIIFAAYLDEMGNKLFPTKSALIIVVTAFLACWWMYARNRRAMGWVILATGVGWLYYIHWK